MFSAMFLNALVLNCNYTYASYVLHFAQLIDINDIESIKWNNDDLIDAESATNEIAFKSLSNSLSISLSRSHAEQ